MKLPEPFLNAMTALLGDSYDAFLASYQHAPVTGLCVNTRKISPQDLLSRLPWTAQPIAGFSEGFTIPPDVKPGAHLAHEAGLYYIQEPSAMLAPSLLPIEPDDFVLDLCAAPGGKAVQLCRRVGENGFFACNEIVPGRAKILVENLERLGLGHSVVFQESPPRLADRFPAFFDKILVDAPCSGEGMFRKNPETILEWSAEQVRACHERQVGILQDAARMLRPGGKILYCTCTFNRDENERTVEVLLQLRPDLRCEKQIRYFPHTGPGEGHFAALLTCAGTAERRRAFSFSARGSDAGMEMFCCKTFARIEPFGDFLCALQKNTPDLSGLKVARAGLQLFGIRDKSPKPAHALAMALEREQAVQRIELDETQARRYLAGEALLCGAARGWTLVCWEGFPLGWAKSADGRLQNHRPKGLRRAGFV